MARQTGLSKQPDPKMLPSLRCCRRSCGKPLPEAAVKNEDPFCSAPCCHAYHGVTIGPTETELRKQTIANRGEKAYAPRKRDTATV